MLAEKTIVPGFDGIIGQKFPVQLLKTFLCDATLPHALLFSGMAGIGKRTAARILSMALNCGEPIDRADPCGRCRSCRQILSDNHPDVLLIEPQGNYLRIDQIRGLLAKLAMKPHHAAHRVITIADAHAMNQEAANALLKVLEEPPKDTTLVLTALQKSDLLPTIVSRCRHIRFNPLSMDDIMHLLTQDNELEPEMVRTAAALSGGSLTKARQLASPFWRDQRNWLIHASGLDQPPQNARRPVASALAFAAELAAKKEQIGDLLEILATWIRDLSIWPYVPDSVMNRDCRDVLDRVRSGMDDRHLLEVWQAVGRAQKGIAAKANLRLTLDVMALGMAGYGQD